MEQSGGHREAHWVRGTTPRPPKAADTLYILWPDIDYSDLGIERAFWRLNTHCNQSHVPDAIRRAGLQFLRLRALSAMPGATEQINSAHLSAFQRDLDSRMRAIR
jgi:hypothetical protein